MNGELAPLSAFLLGLFGSVHCIGMCGAIVGAFTYGLPEAVRIRPTRLASYLIAYNVGRVATYAIAGLLVGLFGAAVTDTLTRELAANVGRLIAGAFMIALGLYLGGWWLMLARLESLGSKLWVRIEPVGRRVLPPRSPLQALLLGLVWGWLPCGMVYSALALALVAGGALAGTATMIAFGLGTLPMLLAMGAAARWLQELARRRWVRALVGALVVGFGVYTLLVPQSHQHRDGAHVHTTPGEHPRH